MASKNPQENKVEISEPDKITEIKNRLAKRGIFLRENDLLANVERLSEISSEEALAQEAEKILAPGYQLG